MKTQLVRSHFKAGKRIASYVRKRRPAGKRILISKKPTKMYLRYDEFGRFKGWSKKPGKQ